MMASPVLIFYIIGLILQLNILYLLKLGLFMALYLVVYGASLLLYDERLMTVMPMAVYLATKVGSVVATSRGGGQCCCYIYSR